MSFLDFCVKHIAPAAHGAAKIFEATGLPLTGLLPARLPPTALVQLIRAHYDRNYDDTYSRFTGTAQEWTLEPWETEVLEQHRILSGKLLVLGTGTGRESIALAKRGFRVMGLDISHSALRMAAHMARTAMVPVTFIQADFLALPSHPASFDYILLPSIMYSSIPGRDWRQTWLRQLTSLLSPGGVAIMQFLIESTPPLRTRWTNETINRWLTRLPGTNRFYQTGNMCPQGHFLHAFQTEQELCQELSDSGVFLRELNWHGRYLVVAATETKSPK